MFDDPRAGAVTTRARLVLVPLAVVLATSFGGAASGAPRWSWRAVGVLTTRVNCPAPGRAVGAAICRYDLPDAPPGVTTEAIRVTVTNGGAHRACFGESVSSSVAAGLRQVCVAAHHEGSMRLVGPARDYRATTLELFVTSGSPTRPIAPQRSTSRCPFTLVVAT